MAGAIYLCMFCCCIISSVIGIFLFGAVLSDFWTIYDYIKSLLFYGIIFSGYYGAFSYMTRLSHNIGIRTMELKHENKTVYKGDKLQSNLTQISLVIFGNLFLVFGSIYLANYFENKYIKYPLIIYLCFIFGNVASYPLSERTILENRQRINDLIGAKTFVNSLIFFAMYWIYNNYY